MSAGTTNWLNRLRQWLPTRAGIAAHPWLRPVAARLRDPQLWRLQHEAVARGVAVGTFWAFVLPVAQIVAATVHCTWWRANIPVAAAMTMLTNPLTIGFWLWLAYQAGIFVVGEPMLAVQSPNAGTLAWVAEFGWPTLVGMGIFAIGGAATGYFGVKLVWRLRVLIKRRRSIFRTIRP